MNWRRSPFESAGCYRHSDRHGGSGPRLAAAGGGRGRYCRQSRIRGFHGAAGRGRGREVQFEVPSKSLQPEGLVPRRAARWAAELIAAASVLPRMDSTQSRWRPAGRDRRPGARRPSGPRAAQGHESLSRHHPAQAVGGLAAAQSESGT